MSNPDLSPASTPEPQLQDLNELRASFGAVSSEVYRITLEGRLEAVSPGALGRLIEQLPPPNPDCVTEVDLSGVGRLGAIGVATLSTLVQGLEQCGHRVGIRPGSKAHRRVIIAFGRPIEEPKQPGSQQLRDFIDRLGERTILVREAFFRFTILLIASMKHAVLQPFRPGRRRFDLTLRSIVQTGVSAVPLVALIAFLIGAILALQAGVLLREYGQALRIADLVGISITKEIAPLLTAVLVAGRSGSSLTAEIGTMKVSEEIDALTVMGVSPVEYLVAPRLRAMVITLPMLTIIADVVGIIGGLIIAHFFFDIGMQAYLDQTVLQVEVGQVAGGLLKAFFFGIVIVSVAAYQGFATGGGASGVGKFTTRSVVQGIIWIIIVDAIFTTILTALEW